MEEMLCVIRDMQMAFNSIIWALAGMDCGSLLLMSAPAIPLLLSQLPRVLGNLHMPLDGEDEHPPGAGFSPQQMLPPVSGPMLGPIGHTLCSFS